MNQEQQTTSWRLLSLTDMDGGNIGYLDDPRCLELLAEYMDGFDDDGSPGGVPDFYIVDTAEDEEPCPESPEGDIDWTGFRNVIENHPAWHMRRT